MIEQSSKKYWGFHISKPNLQSLVFTYLKNEESQNYNIHYLNVNLKIWWKICRIVLLVMAGSISTTYAVCSISIQGKKISILQVFMLLGGVSVTQKIANTKNQPPPFLLLEDNFQSQILRWGSEKNECLGALKEILAHIFAWEAYYVTMFLV